MQKTQAYTFDLDGTLYDFGGDRFSTSRLGAAVRKQYYDLISQRTNQNPDTYFHEMLENEG
jgi:FMN phosphatase YigB (HAD superfamily)